MRWPLAPLRAFKMCESDEPPSPIRRSLSIGLNVVSTLRYGRGVRPLESPVLDAQTFARAATARSYLAALLLDHDATFANVLHAIHEAAEALGSADTFVLTFSGHGLAGQTRDGFQQSWYLFDRPLLRYGSDGLDALLARFRPGVRILIVANCCHSGTNAGPVPTPPIRAEVIRVAACSASEIVEASADANVPSPFIRRFLAELPGRVHGGFPGLIERLQCDSLSAPQLEINDRTTEDFLYGRPFC